MRHFAMTGIVTGLHDVLIIVGSDMRATPPSRADVGRDALEGHDSDRAGVFGDLGLVGRHHVHDHAALEHLGQAALGGPGAGLALHGVPLLGRSGSGEETLQSTAGALAARPPVGRGYPPCMPFGGDPVRLAGGRVVRGADHRRAGAWTVARPLQRLRGRARRGVDDRGPRS